ncbi:DnaA/Hda family protein [Amaricoccus sp.]|uniref:HdaA/DnaA family protein n=1 Tax=Amaricoccus sp. TaxID=1872485 RepID=UPI001B3D26E9|nr:DnaA/Hda family protein [Amaricoccus sp.]MBP7241737.1 chromosomal replication initiator DnaA [Amaricoccus sp.]
MPTGPGQMALDLPSRPALGREDFFVSEPNRLALAQIDAWPDWPSGRLAVAGPPGSGKTHLAHVWASRAAARILSAASLAGVDPGGIAGDAALAVEDVDRLAGLPAPTGRAAEEALFHLCNRLAAGGGSLMVSGQTPPTRWRLALPDLASRLAVAPVATLAPPDDALLAAVLVKLFGDRGVGVTPAVIRFLVARIDRSFEAAEAIVARLDRAGLAQGRPITVPLAAAALGEPEASPADPPRIGE